LDFGNHGVRAKGVKVKLKDNILWLDYRAMPGYLDVPLEISQKPYTSQHLAASM